MSVVVFDLDGTLVHSAPDMAAALNRVIVARGHAALPAAQVEGFIGNGVRVLLERSMATLGAPLAEIEDWEADYLARYGEGLAVTTAPYPGVLPALDALAARGLALGVCTNKPQALTEALLAALGLGGRFGAVIGGDTPLGRKPDPRGLAETVRRLGGGPALLVGDSPADAGAARGAGLPLVLFEGGYREASVAEIAPAASFADWAELPGIVARLLP